MKNYYQILEIQYNASFEQIKKAYYRLAKKYHPDTNDGSNLYRDKLLEIQEAYDVLSDEGKRKQYDSTLPVNQVTSTPTIDLEEEWDWENDPLFDDIRNKNNNPFDEIYYKTMKFLRNKLR